MSTTDAAPPLSTPLVVGVDLGGTKMAAALVTADGALAGPLASVPPPPPPGVGKGGGLGKGFYGFFIEGGGR